MSNLNELCIIATVGFDEKLIVRALMKLGIKERYKVLLVYSLSGGDYERTKVKNAVKNLKEILKPLGLQIRDVEIPVENILEDVKKLTKELLNLQPFKTVAILVGGMRLLIGEVLIALSLYKSFVRPEAEIELFFMREDGTYDVHVPIEVFLLPKVSLRERQILKEIYEEGGSVERPRLVEKESKTLNVSKSQIYKLLDNLEEKKLVEIKDDIIVLTILGKLICMALRVIQWTRKH